MINTKNCKACKGTGQQTGTDGIIRKCPLCEKTIVDYINDVSTGLCLGFIGLGIGLGIIYLFTVSFLLGLLAVGFIYIVVFLVHNCLKCGKLLIFKPKICPNCGTKMIYGNGYFCQSCGNSKIKKYQERCNKCGIKLNWEKIDELPPIETNSM